MKLITDRKARSIQPKQSPIHAGVTGLMLFPGTEPGRGKWILRFVSPTTGKRRDMGLGAYPDDTSVANAIRKARDARALLSDGLDPIEAKRSHRAIPTFEQAARQRHEVVSADFKNEKHKKQWITTLETYVFPTLGNMRVTDLTPLSFAEALKPIWITKRETARRVKMRCSDVMAACIGMGWIESNPLDHINKILTDTSEKGAPRHQPAMPWQHIPKFVHDHLNGELVGAKAALLFVILTGARSGEVRGATWREIDLEKRLWIIPADRMKASIAHTVPLSDVAITLLLSVRNGRADDDLVFTTVSKGVMLSDMALTSVMRDIAPSSDVPDRVATVHGFRSSFRNWCADHEIDRETAERALAHKISNKVQAAYERTDRLKARAQLMQRWAQFCTSELKA
tara:strand:- start:44988 stop:46181 length:1194 start_codon:yes stop_codon:yes gene_type:complete